MKSDRTLVQLRQLKQKFNHAGSKAPDDVTAIAERLGFRLMSVWRFSAKGPLANAVSVLLWVLSIPIYACRVPFGSCVLLQFPELYFSGPVSILLIKFIRAVKRCSIVTLIHDIDELRRDDLDERAFDKTKTKWMMDLTDVFVAHNDQMRDWLVERGIRNEQIAVLGAFDYLTNGAEGPLPSFSRTVVFAGNLARQNTSFIYDAVRIPGVEWELFGPGFDSKESYAHYNGVFPAEELPNKLTCGFGLVWNGSSIETCEGETGRYLRFNYPHKLSLYIAAGLPVIIWSQAAEAKLVRELGIGITVESLDELPGKLAAITPEEYVEFQRAAQPLRDKMRLGMNTTCAIKAAISAL